MTLRDTVERVFTHVGLVKDIAMEDSEKGCVINVTYLPWSGSAPLEELTRDLIEGDVLLNDEYAYMRCPGGSMLMKATICVDTSEENWQRSLAMQMGMIITKELRESVRDRV